MLNEEHDRNSLINDRNTKKVIGAQIIADDTFKELYSLA